MNIIVFQYESLSLLPPTLSLLAALSEKGHNVVFISKSDNSNYQNWFNLSGITYYDLSDTLRLRQGFVRAIVERIRNFRKLLDVIDSYPSTSRLVWTTSENSVAYLGTKLTAYRHVMQLPELFEGKSIKSQFLFMGRVPIASIASSAEMVVVPEYNRAHIQKAWWDLESTPFVLPNTIYKHPRQRNLPITDANAARLIFQINKSGKKIILYQGVINRQRNIIPIIKATAEIGDEYVFCVMGDVDSQTREDLLKFQNVVLIPRQQPPFHLEITSWAYIGVMAYVPKNIGRTILNALFCAPNKIFEFTGFGIPMIANDCPGISNSVISNNIGEIVDMDDKHSIIQAIKTIGEDYPGRIDLCNSFFERHDYGKLVDTLLVKLESHS